MKINILDFIGDADVQETMLFVNNDCLYKDNNNGYCIDLREEPSEDELDDLGHSIDCNGYTIFNRVYSAEGGMGICIHVDDISEKLYGMNLKTYDLVILDHNYGFFGVVDTSDSEKYVAKSFINGKWISRPWDEFKADAVEYFKETGENINNKYLEESKECELFTTAALAVHAMIKTPEQLCSMDEYQKTYDALLPKFKHMLNVVK